jgi:serine/threonine-protein kinase
MDSAIDPLVGRTLNRAYRLESLLGQGGMGAVYKALQLAVKRPVAVKVLHPKHLVGDEETLTKMFKRFEREAMLTSRLEHPNVVRLIDFGRTEDRVMYLVLELLSGRSLAHVMKQEGPFEAKRVARIGRQICLALSAAHRHGIVHRDLKPDNVFLVDYEGVVDHIKVLDFGIARILDADESELTSSNVVLGTPKYMAPEQVQQKQITARTDLYTLGVMLYELLTGQPPFTGDSAMSLAFKHVHERHPRLRDGFGIAWQDLIDRMMAKDPRHRPSDASEAGALLEQLSIEDGRQPLRTALEVPAVPAPRSHSTTAMVRNSYSRTRQPELALGAAPADLAISDPPLRVSEPPKRRIPWVVAFGAAAGIAGGVWLVQEGDDDDPAPESSPSEAATQESKPPALEPTPKQATPEANPKPAPVVTALPPAPPAPARLVLRTTPAGAKVMRDGRPLCTTPCDLSLDARGEASLTVSAERHRERTITVSWQPGAVVEQELVLERELEPVPATPMTARPRFPPPAEQPKTDPRTKKPLLSDEPLFPPEVR